jgi:hypothetical protein
VQPLGHTFCLVTHLPPSALFFERSSPKEIGQSVRLGAREPRFRLPRQRPDEPIDRAHLLSERSARSLASVDRTRVFGRTPRRHTQRKISYIMFPRQAQTCSRRTPFLAAGPTASPRFADILALARCLHFLPDKPREGTSLSAKISYMPARCRHERQVPLHAGPTKPMTLFSKHRELIRIAILTAARATDRRSRPGTASIPDTIRSPFGTRVRLGGPGAPSRVLSRCHTFGRVSRPVV